MHHPGRKQWGRHRRGSERAPDSLRVRGAAPTKYTTTPPPYMFEERVLKLWRSKFIVAPRPCNSIEYTIMSRSILK